MDRVDNALLVLGATGLILFIFVVSAALWPLPKDGPPSDDGDLASMGEKLSTWRVQAEDSDRRLWTIGLVILGAGSLVTATAGFAGFYWHRAAMRRLR